MRPFIAIAYVLRNAVVQVKVAQCTSLIDSRIASIDLNVFGDELSSQDGVPKAWILPRVWLGLRSYPSWGR